MKRIVLLCLGVWLLAIGKTIATNTVTVGSVEVPRGGQATMEITYSIDDAYEGYQLQLQMEDGSKVHPVMLGGKPVMTIDYATHSLTCSNPSENLYNAVCVSLEDGPGKILASSGTLMSVVLEADADATGTYNATLKGIKFAKTGNVEVNLANVEITITIVDPLPLVTLNETDASICNASNGQVDVVVNRNIKANEWNTICLPFDMSEHQVKAVFGNNVRLADFTSWNFEGTPTNVTKINIVFSDVTSILRNHPYIIKVEEDITTFKVYNVEVFKGSASNSNVYNYYDEDEEEDFQYTGTMTGVRKTGTVANNSIFLANNKFYYSTGSTNIKAYRATFNFGNIVLSDPSPSRITMSFDEPSSETTGIKDVKVVRSDKVYNLSGQQVKNPAKGIYVKDGKKVIIK